MDYVNDQKAYSLEVDPDDKYHFTEKERAFVYMMAEYKNLSVVASMMEISPSEAKAMMSNVYVMEELRRLNLAFFHRRIAVRAMSVDEMASWLTSLISDESVPLGDQLTSKEKVKVAALLLDTQKFLTEVYRNPVVFDATANESLEDKISQLSVGEIKKLLYEETKKSKVEETVDRHDRKAYALDPERTFLMPEEKMTLDTLPESQLDSMREAAKPAQLEFAKKEREELEKKGLYSYKRDQKLPGGDR